MDIDSPEPVATCCAFFAPGFVERLFRDLTQPDATSLDDPLTSGRELLFLARLRPVDAQIARTLAELERRARSSADPLSMDELYTALAWHLLRVSEETRSQLNRIPAARASTRAELLKRVSRGRELLHASHDQSPTLAEAARAAAMSPFHFQRTFQQAFGVSPSSYLARLRFERASALLRHGRSVTEAALNARYRAPAAFCTAFRKHFGMTPSSYAAQFSKKAKAVFGRPA